MGSGPWTVGSGQWVVGSEQWALDTGLTSGHLEVSIKVVPWWVLTTALDKGSFLWSALTLGDNVMSMFENTI